MIALNNLLSKFNKQLFEIDLLKEERSPYPQQSFDRARANKIENISLSRLYNIFNSKDYTESIW